MLTRGYPDYMLESIDLVEATRDRRLKESVEVMRLEEREEILRKYHPDYNAREKRPVRLGPNQGDAYPHEVVNILEAHPLIHRSSIDLAHLDFDLDILIIGGGGAGMTAALWAVYSGVKPENLLIVQKLRLGDSNSIMS